MTATINTIADYVATFRADLVEHQKMLASSLRSLVSHGWIVVIRSPSLTEGGLDDIMATDFTVEGRKVTNPRMSSVLRCTRFTKEDAISIASGVHNGKGEQGEAMTVINALRHQIATLEGILATIARDEKLSLALLEA
jgi:hypothetical protein